MVPYISLFHWVCSLIKQSNTMTFSVLVPGSLALALALATAALGLTTGQGRSGRTLLGQGLWEDLRGKVKHFTEVFDALVGQGVVVPTPAVDFLQVVAGSKGPQDHHHVQVWDVLQLIVLARLLLGQHLESFKTPSLPSARITQRPDHHDLLDRRPTLKI